MKKGPLWRFSILRQVKFLHITVKQDRRRIKSLVWPGLGFKSFGSASRTIIGGEVTAMIRKDRVMSAPAPYRPSATSSLLGSWLLPDLRPYSAYA